MMLNELHPDECCDEIVESDGRTHDGMCDNYDGAPDHQWEVTTPGEAYYTDEDYATLADEADNAL